ncbi:MAG: hypothetical protein ACLQBX_03620 [Candidatus Limnocylindrales bacterium]
MTGIGSLPSDTRLDGSPSAVDEVTIDVVLDALGRLHGVAKSNDLAAAIGIDRVTLDRVTTQMVRLRLLKYEDTGRGVEWRRAETGIVRAGRGRVR